MANIKYTTEEIKDIDFWTNRLFPKSGQFFFVDEYTTYIEESNPSFKTYVYSHWEGKARHKLIFLEQSLVMETYEVSANIIRQRLTPRGIAIAEAGGYIQYLNIQEEERFLRESDRQLVKDVSSSTIRLNRFQIPFLWANGLIALFSLLTAIFVGCIVYKQYVNDGNDKDQSRQLLEQIDKTKQQEMMLMQKILLQDSLLMIEMKKKTGKQ